MFFLNLQLVIQGIFASLRRMVYVFFVGILILLIFGVIGVHLFKVHRVFVCLLFDICLFSGL